MTARDPWCVPSSAVLERVNELAMLRNAVDIPLLAEEGWTRHQIKWIRSEIGAAGVVSSAKLFRPKHFAELTTIMASRYRARASRPAAASMGGFAPFIDAAAFPSSARRGISLTQLLVNSVTPSMTAHNV